MAFNHKLMATMGLYPGMVSTRSVANLGHFELEIKLTVHQPGTAGGAVSASGRRKKDKYTVTMQVSYKQRVWSYETEVSQMMASVIAKMTGQKMPVAHDPVVDVTSVREVKPNEPEIKVEKR